MNKNLITLILFCFSTFIFAQKASVKPKKIEVTFEQPDFLKHVKTFTYTLQGEDKYWNYTPTPEFPTLTSVTQPLNLSGLEQVETDGDIQIIVGFLGNQLKKGQAVLNLQGTYNVIILNKNNELITSLTDTVDKQVIDDPKKYGTSTRDARNVTKAKIVTKHVEKMLKEIEHVFSGTADVELPFGLFRKVKGGPAETYNAETQTLIDAILANPTDVTILDKGIAYWKSQLDVDFGKKMKDKIKGKVINANLTSAYILKNDIENARQSFKTVEGFTGLFDSWPAKFRSVFKRYDALNNFTKPILTTINVTDNSMYYITIDGGTYTYKQKNPITFSKIEIDAFTPNIKSGVVSLDATSKPKIYIYEDGVKTLRHFGDGKNLIVTKDGTEIFFTVHKGSYVPVVKQADGSLLKYNSNEIIKK